MGTSFDDIKRGIAAGVEAIKNHPAQKFQAGDKPVVCSHCGGDMFQTAGVVGVSLAGHGLECAKCSHIEYFGKQPVAIPH